MRPPHGGLTRRPPMGSALAELRTHQPGDEVVANKNGTPPSHSDFAHIGDAISYAI
jgi:hypothetical protein